MAMVNVKKDWSEAVLNEIESIHIYDALITILHRMTDDDVYSVEDCFKDVQNLAIQVRRNIDGFEFPVAKIE